MKAILDHALLPAAVPDRWPTLTVNGLIIVAVALLWSNE